MFGLLLDSRPGRTNNVPLLAAEKAPAMFTDIQKSSWDNGMYNNRYVSQMSTEREIQDELYNPIIEKYGLDQTKLRQDAQQYFSLKESKALNRFATSDREAYYAALQDALPDESIPGMSEVTNLAAARSRSYAEQFEDDMRRSITSSPRVAAALGEMATVFADPVQVTAILATSPVAITTRVVASGAIEAGINVAMEAPLARIRASWYEKQGRELTTKEQAYEVLFSSVFGFGIGSGMSVGYRAFGGTNKDFFNFFPAEGKKAEAVSLEQRQTANSTGRPAGSDTYINYEVDSDVANPFVQTPRTVESYIYEAAYDPSVAANPTVRYNMVGAADALNYEHSKPMTWTFRDPDNLTSSGYDFTLNRLERSVRGGDLSPMESHKLNVFEAVSNLAEGRVLSPRSQDALTMDITLSDGPARINDIRSFREAGTAISMKSKDFRAYVFKLIREVSEGRLQRIADSAELPPRYTVPGKRPPMSKEAIRKERIAINNELAEGGSPEYKKYFREYANTEVALQDVRARKNQMERRIGRGEEVPEKDILKLEREEKRILKTQKNVNKKFKKLDRKHRSRQKAMKKKLGKMDDIEGQWVQWDGANEAANDYRVAVQAATDLETLRQGRVPKSLKGLQDDLVRTFQELQKTEEVLRRADNGTFPSVMEMMGGLRRPYDELKAFELDSVTRVADDWVSKTEVEAVVAESRRVDQSFRFFMTDEKGDITEMTMGEVLEEVDQLDNAMAVARECNI